MRLTSETVWAVLSEVFGSSCCLDEWALWARVASLLNDSSLKFCVPCLVIQGAICFDAVRFFSEAARFCCCYVAYL